MPFKNRIRLPFFLSKPQFPMERNIFRKADGSSKLLSTVIRNTYEGKTDDLPEDWHRKLVIALAHDEVTVEDNRLLTDVVLDGDYSIDWQDFLNNPIAQSKFTIQTTPFNATNSNCQTCEEISQLNLVDDTTVDVWVEGTTNEFPDLLTANDYICCYPFTVSISTFNSLYFDSVTVAPDGTLTATVKGLVPTISNVLIATYRVTCENGGYDEANVYGNIEGTSTECIPIENFLPVSFDATGTIASVAWSDSGPRAGGYDWFIYLASDIYTVLQSGNTASPHVDIFGLTPSTQYVVTVNANCGGGSTSTSLQQTFITSNPENTTCGKFRVTYNYGPGSRDRSYSYFDCEGELQNRNFGSIFEVREVCMLIPSGQITPVYFATDSLYIDYEYIGLC